MITRDILNLCSLPGCLVFIFIISLVSCTSSESQEEEVLVREPSTYFFLHSPDSCLVDFENNITPKSGFSILDYPYFYNGGGLAIGDVNRDSLPDIFFTANQGKNQLFLNQGNFKFSNVSEQAGITGQDCWTTGATMADVNADGWLDIYVSYVGDFLDQKGHNELFINQQDGTFREESKEYGLDLVGFGTQAVFFDYDLDGDLDMFQLNHSIKPASTIGDTSQRAIPDPLAGDKLMRNEGGRFIDVSREAGLRQSRLGYGLGVQIGDWNQDAYPDIYVGNDFHEDDYLYINQGNGRFTEELREFFGHTSRFSMGVDAADVNQDGLLDLMTLDMKPAHEDIIKTAESPESYELFEFKRSFGYYYQYPHNALQINNGNGSFREVAQLAGVDATDWSWSVLFADLDLDGLQDIFISNGIWRRPNDMDYLKFVAKPEVTRKLQARNHEDDLTFIQQMPQISISNFAYRNAGDLEFHDYSETWGLDQQTYSSGAAYADLDGDGDLDLILNNLNAKASILENKADSVNTNHYLKLEFEGNKDNPEGIGTHIWAYMDGRSQYFFHMPVRGFQSSVEPGILFGLGNKRVLDSLIVLWPQGSSQLLKEISANQKILLREEDASDKKELAEIYPVKEQLFYQNEPDKGINFTHQENIFVDQNRERLIPHMLSTEGPAAAYADVNGDGVSDLYLGGALGQASGMFMGREDSSFQQSRDILWQANAAGEAVDATFVDIDGDLDLDLYVVHGGNQFPDGHELNQDHLYINDGKGKFTLDLSRLPDMRVNGACVTSADWDGDGDIDLFVGARSKPGEYGLTPTSRLLENDGIGNFTYLNTNWVKSLENAGMLTDADFFDYDKDGDPDLVLVGEWMHPVLFENKNRRLIDVSGKAGLGLVSGWWMSLHVEDMDLDGDKDLIFGNWGTNSYKAPNKYSPWRLYISDFDENGATDPIISYKDKGKWFTLASKDALTEQLVSIRRKFPHYADFAGKPVEEIFEPEKLRKASTKEINTFLHYYAENQGDGSFQLTPLNRATQVSPVFAIASGDWNKDGQRDLLLGGNFYGVGPDMGRYDASQGHVLLSNPKSGRNTLSPLQSGLNFQGQVRAIIPLSQNELLIVRNNDKPLIYRLSL